MTEAAMTLALSRVPNLEMARLKNLFAGFSPVSMGLLEQEKECWSVSIYVEKTCGRVCRTRIQLSLWNALGTKLRFTFKINH
jgi:hypothetical protein